MVITASNGPAAKLAVIVPLTIGLIFILLYNGVQLGTTPH